MLEDIIRLLHEGKHSLVVSNGEVRTFDRRGVADLYALLREDSDFLKGASVADKVVGKAAAALMILGEVGELHADVVSRPALDLFADSGVRVSYGQPYKDGMVPAGNLLPVLPYSTGLSRPN